MGQFVANLRRGRGDYMGVAGHLNDGASYTCPVIAYWPNDYGLYNMAGNVAEWVMDVYRPLSAEDKQDLDPYRGNVYTTHKLLDDGTVEDRDEEGNVPTELVSDFKNDRRRNYRAANNINYLDGDWASQLESDAWTGSDNTLGTNQMYKKIATSYSMIDDNARVYKGGSWKDIQYWASPGNRRYLDQTESTDYIGFRCAMSRLGSSDGK
jgi:gliding motility-associated lipoprotein GldJ